MKKILFGLILCGTATFGACNLDTVPTDKYTVETFWETEEGVEAAMTGCYNVLVSDALFGGSAPLLEETCSPNAYNYNDAGGYNVIALGTHTANSSGIIENRWAKCYEGIGRCNTHLNRLPDAAVSDERRLQMEGETKFLRALYYYMLVTYYNGVPLILEEPVYEHGSLPRDSREKVVEAILADLNDIIDRELLDWKWSATDDQGRVTRGAAMALKARLLLFEASPLLNPTNDTEKWRIAADAARALIEKESMTGYDLFADYRDLFLPANEHSCECVFNIEFSKTKGTTVNSYNVYSIQYRNNAPLLDLVLDYETTSGGPATMGKYDNLDPRFAATNFYPGSTFLGKANCPAAEVCQFTGFAHKKLTIYDEQARDSDDGNGETNYMFIRYADVLLMFAEAQNEVDATPSDAVYDAVNRVRERVGMPTFAYGSRTKDEMREIIRHERRIEFAGEGLYYNDIRRWKTAELVMNDVIEDYAGTAIAVRTFDPDRDYWWPIPSDQLLLNKNLEQNPNY